MGNRRKSENRDVTKYEFERVLAIVSRPYWMSVEQVLANLEASYRIEEGRDTVFTPHLKGVRVECFWDGQLVFTCLRGDMESGERAASRYWNKFRQKTTGGA